MRVYALEPISSGHGLLYIFIHFPPIIGTQITRTPVKWEKIFSVPAVTLLRLTGTETKMLHNYSFKSSVHLSKYDSQKLNDCRKRNIKREGKILLVTGAFA